MIGQRFGSLVVRGVRRLGGVRPTRALACECDCGLWTQATLDQMVAGRRTACGACERKVAVRRVAATKHARFARHSDLAAIAHAKVARAVKRGVLVAPKLCTRCACPGRIVGHHEDYTRPLDVVWLCEPCHKARHIELRDEAFARSTEAA